MKLHIVAGAVVCLCAAACGRGVKTNADVQIVASGDTITVSAESSVLHKLKYEKVTPEPFCSEFRTVGTVRAIAGRLAEVAAPFDGRVSRASVQLGQRVSAGTPVFELGSSDFYEASKAYFQAVRSHETAQKNYLRKKELLTGGIASQRDLDEAQTEAENSRREMEQAEASLRVFNVDPANLQMGQSLKVCSPIAGEVVACDITVGQFVKTDAAPLATVADLSRVWVTALVKEKYFGAIHKGDKVEIYTDAEPDRIVWGEIYHIGEILDEQTRSVQVLVECDNTDRRLKPGMFTSVHFLSQPHDAVVLPSTVLFQTEQSSYVFTQEGENRFVRRRVKAESVKGNKVHIIDGLSGGETVVTEGGIFLTE